MLDVPFVAKDLNAVSQERGVRGRPWLRRAANILLIVLGLFSVCSASAFDDPEAEKFMADPAGTLLKAGDLDGFDRLASEFRASHARNSSGVWKLYLLYSGLRWIRPRAAGDPRWAELEQSVRAWSKAHPKSPTGPILLAEILTERAWEYRGFGLASKIPGQNLDPFANYVDKARSVLDANRAVSQADPQWYTQRIEVANLEGDDKASIMQLAKEGLAQEPTYYPIVYAAAVAFQPRWGGSRELILRLVDMAVAASKATEGSQTYARVYLHLQHIDATRRNMVEGDGLDWPRMRSSLNEIVHAYPSVWNRNLQRATTCAEGTIGDYRAVMEGFQGPVVSVEHWDSAKWRKDCDDWAFHGKVFGQAPQSGLSASFPLLYLFQLPLTWACLIALSFAVAVIEQRVIPQRQSNPGISFDPSAATGGSAGSQPLLGRPIAPDPMLFPRFYWISSGWQFPSLFVGGALTVLGAFLIVASILTPSSTLWNVKALAIAAGALLAGLGIYIGISVRFSRICIDVDSVERRGLFSTRRIPMASIIGRRTSRPRRGPPTTLLVMKPGLGRPLRIEGTFATDTVYQSWLRFIPDLDQNDYELSERSIYDDEGLGGSRESRKERLAEVRRLARPVNTMGYVVAAWGWIYPRPYPLVVLLLVALPLVGVGLASRFRGYVQFGQKKSDARVGLSGVVSVPALALGLRAAIDTRLFDWLKPVEIAIVSGVFLTLVLAKLFASQRMHPIVLFGLVAAASMYSYGTLVGADRLLDRSTPLTVEVAVEGKHMTRGRSRSWELTLAPWGPWSRPEDFRVPSSTYAAVQLGDSVCALQHPGALGMAWYEFLPCHSPN